MFVSACVYAPPLLVGGLLALVGGLLALVD